MARTGARVLLDALQKRGVEYIFGIPGTLTLPLYDALIDFPIEPVVPRHEQGAGFAAVLDQVVKSIGIIIDQSPDHVSLIIENSAGMGQHICCSFSEIGQVINAVGSPRIKVCLDTQHLFAAGHNIIEQDGLQRVIAEFDEQIGLNNLVAVHANDSKTPIASGVDRHDNIGQGNIGLDGFRVIMSNEAFADIPFLLEVPGNDGNGPDKANVDALKELRHELTL